MEIILLIVQVVVGLALVAYALGRGRGETQETIERRVSGRGNGAGDKIIRKARSMGHPTFLARAAPLFSSPITKVFSIPISLAWRPGGTSVTWLAKHYSKTDSSPV